MKKLHKSKTDRPLTGLLGGVGEYINVDPVLVRLFFIFLMLVTGIFPLALFYLIAIFVVPEKPDFDYTVDS